MIRFSLVLIAIVCISISTSLTFAEENAAEGSTIRGEVIEALGENAPVEGATVKIVNSDGKEFAVRTDAKGKYEFTGIPAGRYTINVYKRGYSPRIGRQKVVGEGGEVFDRIKMRKSDDFETRFVEEGLLQHVAEDIGKRYELDASIVKNLYKSIFEAVDTVLEQENGETEAFAEGENYASIGILMGMLAHPDCRAAFAKYLTETQLQDYINFTKTRQHQVKKTVVQLITAFLDQALSLTSDQRKNMVKLLLQTINDKPELGLMGMFSPTLQEGTVNLLHSELNISLDSVLNQTQSKIWQELIKFYDDRVEVVVLEAPHDDGVENDKTDEDPPKSQIWMLHEVILTAHTTQLGLLNKSASKRLEIATKGVLQQYMEMELPDIDYKFKFVTEINSLIQAFMGQHISREQAIEKLESMKKEVWREWDTSKRWNEDKLYNITNHPLYQQAIKDVLSEDAYLQYKARQAERENFRVQALRDLVLSFMDMLVLLDDVQRQQLKMTAAQLTVPSLINKGFQLMWAEFFIKMDNKIFNPMQQSILFMAGK